MYRVAQPNFQNVKVMFVTCQKCNPDIVYLVFLSRIQTVTKVTKFTLFVIL